MINIFNSRALVGSGVPDYNRVEACYVLQEKPAEVNWE